VRASARSAVPRSRTLCIYLLVLPVLAAGYVGGRQAPVPAQCPDNLCGPVCLTFCARWLGISAITVDQVVALTRGDRTATSLAALERAAVELQLEAECYKPGLEEFGRVTSATPGIAHVDGSHFVVAWTTAEGDVRVVEPLGRSYQIELREFGRRWNGVVLVISPPGQQPAWPLPAGVWVLVGTAFGMLGLGWFTSRTDRQESSTT